MKFFDLELNGLSVEMINLNSTGLLSKKTPNKPVPYYEVVSLCIKYNKENCNRDARNGDLKK